MFLDGFTHFMPPLSFMHPQHTNCYSDSLGFNALFHKGDVPGWKARVQITVSLDLSLKFKISWSVLQNKQKTPSDGGKNISKWPARGNSKSSQLRPPLSVALLRNVPLCLPCSSMNKSKPGREENVPLLVPPLGLFFMSRVKSGFCLIRRHGCPRKPESHDAASSPQSTVSTLEEEEGLGTRGKSTVWCFLFGAASNPVITGWNAFLTCDLPHKHVRRFTSSSAHFFFFFFLH